MWDLDVGTKEDKKSTSHYVSCKVSWDSHIFTVSLFVKAQRHHKSYVFCYLFTLHKLTYSTYTYININDDMYYKFQQKDFLQFEE